MTARIALVGAGPRNLSVLERLLAGLTAAPSPVEITVFDPAPAGAGRIWDPEQPRELLMNSRAGQVTIFADSTVPVSGPRRPGPTLLEWARTIAAAPEPSTVPEAVRQECSRLDAVTFPSRRLYGAYLHDIYASLVADVPAECSITHVPRRILDLTRIADHPAGTAEGASPADAGRFRLHDDRGRTYPADAVVLAPGWLPAEHDQPDSPDWTGPENPREQDLSSIRAGQSVLLTGLGMSMFDNLARLTIGRGGRFSTSASGELSYVRSGREPRIVVGSMTGMPFWPKPELAALPRPSPRPHLRALLDREPPGGSLRFEEEIWPALVADAAAEYYGTLERHSPTALRRPLTVATEHIHRISASGAAAHELLAPLADAVLEDPSEGLDAAELLGISPPESGEDYTTWLRRRLRVMVSHAEAGDTSPLLRALTSLAGGRAALVEPLSAGRLTAASRRDGYPRYRSLAAKFGGGPPSQRVRQLLVLLEQGVVSALGPGLRAEPAAGAGFACHDRWGGGDRVDHVVESWMHAPSLQRTVDPLLRALREAGWAAPFVARDESGEFVSEALHVDPEDLCLISERGTRVAGVHAAGIPSDDQLGHSVISPVPCSGSTFLQQTDRVARGVLAHLRYRDAPPNERTGRSAWAEP